jgi:hypothetical protein
MLCWMEVSGRYVWLEGPLLHQCWGCLRSPNNVFWIRSEETWTLTNPGQCYTRDQAAKAAQRNNFRLFGSYCCGQMSCLDPHVLTENYTISFLQCHEGKEFVQIGLEVMVIHLVVVEWEKELQLIDGSFGFCCYRYIR